MRKIFAFLLLLPVLSFRLTPTEDFFFGDSVTFGNELGLLQYTARWSTKYCNDVGTTEDNHALSGATMTPGLITGRPVFDIAEVPAYQSSNNHIFVSYWINDFMYGGTTSAFITATTNAVNGIIAKGWPANKIVLCFNYLTPAIISYTNAMAWRAALKSVQSAKGTLFLDFFTPIYNMPNNATYSTDGIHPTSEWNTIMDSLAQTNIEAAAPVTLPATLLSFAGQRQGVNINLKWTVAQEENVEWYSIERSENGQNWNTAGKVASLGNTTTQRTYSFSDNSAGAVKQLYRLRQTDLNGAVKLSPVIIVNGAKTSVFAIGGLFPNPVAGAANILIEAPLKDRVNIAVLDQTGRILKTVKAAVEAGSNTVSLDMDQLPAGSYVVRVTSDGNSQSVASRFIKN